MTCKHTVDGVLHDFRISASDFPYINRTKSLSNIITKKSQLRRMSAEERTVVHAQLKKHYCMSVLWTLHVLPLRKSSLTSSKQVGPKDVDGAFKELKKLGPSMEELGVVGRYNVQCVKWCVKPCCTVEQRQRKKSGTF